MELDLTSGPVERHDALNNAGDRPLNAIRPILTLTVLVLALDLAAIRFGADSGDRIGSSDANRLR